MPNTTNRRAEIKSRHEEGQSMTAIANAMGYSFDYVRKVLNGRAEPTYQPKSVAHRCRGCGGLVYGKCKLCAMRRETA